MGNSKLTSERAKELGRLGGIKSGESRRRKGELKNIAQDILSLGMRDGDLETFDNISDAKGKNLSLAESIFIAQALKALKGDKQAAEFCFNYGGMKPSEKYEIEADVNTSGELENIFNILEDYTAAKKKD